jgi:hypothetical protein
MDADSILQDLTFAPGLPREALAAANERRAELTPLFLAEIDRWLSAGSTERAEPSPLFFVFHLFGAWRETAAYRPLARLLRAKAEDVDYLLGDCTTETSHRVMAAVFDGDPEPIYGIILDPEADEYVRSAMCEVLAILVRLGRLERGEAARFLAEAHVRLKPRAANLVWQGWQSAIAMLGLTELKGPVREAFRLGYIDKFWLHYEHFEHDLAQAPESPEAEFEDRAGRFALFGDVIEEMQHWAFASAAEEDDGAQATREGVPPEEDPAVLRALGAIFNTARDLGPENFSDQPFVAAPKPGRNDPCPCGSGKKYKKCCGA